MSFFAFPDVLLSEVFGTWLNLELTEAARLDVAITNRLGRPEFLKVLSSLPFSCKFMGEGDYNFRFVETYDLTEDLALWLIERKIKLTELVLSENCNELFDQSQAGRKLDLSKVQHIDARKLDESEEVDNLIWIIKKCPKLTSLFLPEFIFENETEEFFKKIRSQVKKISHFNLFREPEDGEMKEWGFNSKQLTTITLSCNISDNSDEGFVSFLKENKNIKSIIFADTTPHDFDDRIENGNDWGVEYQCNREFSQKLGELGITYFKMPISFEDSFEVGCVCQGFPNIHKVTLVETMSYDLYHVAGYIEVNDNEIFIEVITSSCDDNFDTGNFCNDLPENITTLMYKQYGFAHYDDDEFQRNLTEQICKRGYIKNVIFLASK